MTQLRLVSQADDGSHLLLASDTGEEFMVPVTDELSAAVRRARLAAASRPSAQPAPPANSISPKEIQRRIRAGLNAAEISQMTGIPLASMEAFEGPVLAERSYVAQLARTTRIGHDATSPMLGDLVADRLAGRGVDGDQLEWDAYRDDGSPWTVTVDYAVEGGNVRAQWSFDHVARTLTALDEESRWLSETELLDVPIPRRHLTAVKAGESTAEALPVASEPASATEVLLEDLASKRGTREPLDPEAEEFEGFGPAARARESAVSFTHPSVAGREEEPEKQPEAPAPTKRSSAKKGRASVPSWDEIVFGAKSDKD